MQRQINQEHHHQLETIWFSGYTIQNPSVCQEKCTTVCAFQHHLACNLNRKSEFCAHKTNWVSIISCGAAAVKNRVWQSIFILMNCQGHLEQGWVRTPALENSIKTFDWSLKTVWGEHLLWRVSLGPCQHTMLVLLFLLVALCCKTPPPLVALLLDFLFLEMMQLLV